MVNFRSKSNSPCRSKKTRNESPLRITLNIKTKLRIAEKHKQESKTILHLAEELKIPYSTVQRAITKKNELMIVSSDRCRVYGGGRKQIYPAICEFELYQFILAKNEKGNKVDYKLIREQAIKILDDYCNVYNIEENKKPKLKFSDCWINDFMHRRRLSVRQKTHVAQSNKVSNFKICFEYLVRLNRQAKNILLAKIRNIDETPVYLDSPSNRTICPIGTKTVTIADTGHSKERFTVCVDIGADGSMKKALVLIARKNIPKCWYIPSNLIVLASEKATMNEYLMKVYIEKYLSKSDIDLLIMDEYRVKPDMELCLQWISQSLNRITPQIIKRSFECCGLKDGDWQSFEHLNERIQKLFQVKIGIDDWDDELALLDQFNKEKNLDNEFLNAESIIDCCSQENFEITDSLERQRLDRLLHLDEVIAECSQDYEYYN